MTTLAPTVSETEKARKSGEGRGFRPDIQGLRAIAVAMVVVYHLYPAALPGGFAGVDVFFVISGYLITGHLWRGYARTGKVGLVDFWGRRARRLVPAAALVLTVTWIVSRIVQPATQLADTARQILASALYFQNWQLSGGRGQLPEVQRHGQSRAALLVPVSRGAVLHRLAAAVPGRGFLAAVLGARRADKGRKARRAMRARRAASSSACSRRRWSSRRWRTRSTRRRRTRPPRTS